MSSNSSTSFRCLLWGTGQTFWNYLRLVKSYETSNQIHVDGITSKDSFYSSVGEYRFFDKCAIDKNAFDIVIIMSDIDNVVREITLEAQALGFPNYCIMPCKVLLIPDFDFEKYIEIKKNPPTIFAPNCWGGTTYHYLGLRFDSPFINMFEEKEDYLHFLSNPEHYLAQDLKYKEMQFQVGIDRYYPVAECGDILLHFNHYISFEDAKRDWDRRKERVHWNNLFVMFYDEKADLVDEFCNLPYSKKVCFTPFDYDNENVISVNYLANSKMKDVPFWEIVNGMASGKWLYYNVLDLLLYNKFTPLANLNTGTK